MNTKTHFKKLANPIASCLVISMAMIFPPLAHAQLLGISITLGSSATGNNALAAGQGSLASATGSIALGTNSTSAGLNATALGTGANASLGAAVAIGASATAAQNATAIGTTATASGTGSLALGNNTLANASGALALGAGSNISATATNSVALGNLTSVTGTNSVAIGSGTTVSANNTVGIGNRTLSQVSAGVSATDAVNLGQLNTAISGVNNVLDLTLGYDDSNKTSVTLGGLGATTAVSIHNLANGVLAGDAVNVAQLNGVSTQVNALNGLSALTTFYDNSAKTGLTLGGTGATATVGLHNVANGTLTTDAVNVGQLNNTVNSVVGNAITANNANLISFDSVAKNSVTLGGLGATTSVALHNVSDGLSLTDAVNLGQLNTVSNNLGAEIDSTNNALSNLSGTVNTLDALNLKYDTNGKTSITLGGIGATTSVTLHNIASGVALNDAVNVGQMNSTVDTVVANAISSLDSIVYDDNTKTSLTLGGVGATATVGLHNVGNGVALTDAVNVGQLNNVNNSLTNTINNVNTTLSNNINGVSTTLNTLDNIALKYDSTTKDSVTLGGAGATIGVKIGNVAAGTNLTDAVNLGQLNNVSDNLNALGLTVNGLNTGLSDLNNIALKYDDLTKTGVTLGGVGASSTVSLHNVAAGVSSTDAVNMSQLNTTNTTLANLNTQLTGLDNIALKYDSIAKTGVTLGATGTPVSLHNLAQGVAATDAVNVAQLQTTVANATDNALTYDSNSKTSLTLGGVGATAAVSLHNVAAGINATDAVNVSQLNNVDTTLTNSINSLSSTVTSLDASNIKYDNGAKDSITLGGTGAVTPVALHNVANAVQGNDAVNLNQLNSLLNATPTAALAIQYDDIAKTSVTLGGIGSATPVSLHNVAAGSATNDAVNFGQLTSTVTTALNNAKTYTDTQIQTVTSNPSSGGSGGVVSNPTQVIQQANTYTDTTAKSTLSQAESYTDTQTQSVLTQANTYTDNSVAQANNYTDQKFNSVNQRIDGLQNQINGVAAGSAAMSALVYNPNGGQNYVSGAVSNYRNAQGIAFGYFRKLSNDRIVVNVKVGGATRGGNIAVAAGMGYSW